MGDEHVYLLHHLNWKSISTHCWLYFSMQRSSLYSFATSAQPIRLPNID